MKKWSDLWDSPEGLVITIVILFIMWGIFHPDQMGVFFDMFFLILVNKILPIVIVMAIIAFLLKGIKGGK